MVGPNHGICEAARNIRGRDIGTLPVCDKQRLVGSITDRDFAIRAVAYGFDALSTKVFYLTRCSPRREDEFYAISMTPEIFVPGAWQAPPRLVQCSILLFRIPVSPVCLSGQTVVC